MLASYVLSVARADVYVAIVMPPDPTPSGTAAPAPPPPAYTSALPPNTRLAETQATSFPFSFGRPFHSNVSSTSLVPSTAEGKPIPVDDSTAKNRTSALRHFNKTNPSKHRYARSTGAQNSTFSEPVIVRSYYNPAPSQPPSTSRGGFVAASRRRTPSQPYVAAPTTSVSKSTPFVKQVTSAKDGVLNGMTRFTGKRHRGAEVTEEAKLPPMEAFTFKSFLENMESQSSGNDINADLDRIAEICARSRYSLSSQHEVHYAPHGSGSSFLGSGSQDPEIQGPTLQVVPEEEENSTRSRRRRHGVRRNSRAMGTLETIMSSSRSSDEDKSGKKSAAEIAEEVRRRAAIKDPDESSPSSSVNSPTIDGSLHDAGSPVNVRSRRGSVALALLEAPRPGTSFEDATTPRGSSSALLSEPAQPKTSTSQLEIRTTSEVATHTIDKDEQDTADRNVPRARVLAQTVAFASNPRNDGILSAFTSWIPWRPKDETDQAGRAEGSLRDLLKTSQTKGKGVTVLTGTNAI